MSRSVGKSGKVRALETTFAAAARYSSCPPLIFHHPFEESIFDGDRLLHPQVASCYLKERSGCSLSSSAATVRGLSADEKKTPGGWRASKRSTPHRYGEAQAWFNKAAHQERHHDSTARTSQEEQINVRARRWKFSKSISADIVKEHLDVPTFPNSMTKVSKERRLRVFFLHGPQLGATSPRMPGDVTSLVTICRRTVTLR